MRHQKVHLRRLELSDCRQLASMADNKKVWDGLRDYFPHPYNEEDARAFIQLTHQESPQQNFAIEYEGIVCGVMGVIIQSDVYQKTGEIGYWLGEPYWGMGIATIAVNLISNYGLKDLNLVRVFASVFSSNPASMAVLEKNDFTKEGISRNAIWKNGQLYDEHRYAKLREIQ